MLILTDALLNAHNHFLSLPPLINPQFLKKVLFIFGRERESVSGRGIERKTQNPKQVPGSELPAQSWTRGSNPQTVIS